MYEKNTQSVDQLGSTICPESFENAIIVVELFHFWITERPEVKSRKVLMKGDYSGSTLLWGNLSVVCAYISP